MKRPCHCDSACPCHNAIALTWQNERDFATSRDLSDAATYSVDPRVWTDQPRGTRLLWRIVMVGQGYLGGPIKDGTVLQTGPIVGSTMAGDLTPHALSLGPYRRFSSPSWYWYGNSAFPELEPNSFRLEVGCLACDCFCVNDSRIAWPGESTAPLNYHERTATYWNGDADESAAAACDSSVGFLYSGHIDYGFLLGYHKVPRAPEDFSDAIVAAGAKPRDLGPIVGLGPADVPLDGLDVIFYERTGQQTTHPFGLRNRRNRLATEAEVDALKNWLDGGNRTLVLSSGIPTGVSPQTVETYAIAYSYAEAAFGVPMYARKTRSHAGPPLSAAIPDPHILTDGATPFTVYGQAEYDIRNDGLTTGTPLWSCEMDFAGGAETVAQVALHDVGNGSRIIVGAGPWQIRGLSNVKLINRAGFLHTQSGDAFIANAIAFHGLY